MKRIHPLAAAPMIACAAAMLWAVRGALDPRLILLSWDFQGHLLRARFWLSDAAGAGSLGAWFPYWHGGFPMYDVYPPLATWLLALLSAAGAADLGGRLLLAAVWIAAVPASFHFLRRFGVSPVASALAACLVPALDATRTFGIQAIFWLGLLPNALGFVLSILALAEARALLGERPTGRQAARVALLGGLTVLAHPFCAYWLALAGAALFIAQAPGRAGLGRRTALAVAAVAGAAAVGAIYWYPLFAGRANLLATDPFVSRSVTGTWKTLAAMGLSGGLPVAVLALAGFAALAVPGRRRALAYFALSAGVAFALSIGVIPAAGELAGPSQRARFEGFYLWSMLMAGGFAIDAALRAPWPRLRPALAAAAVLLPVWVAGHAVARARPIASAVAPVALDDLDRLSERLGQALTPGDFILSENDRAPFRRLGSPHFLNQRLPAANPYFWDQGGSLPEGTRGARDAFALSRQFPDGILNGRRLLEARGVRFVATIRQESAEALEAASWLRRIWPAREEAAAGLALFEVTPFERRLGLPRETADRLESVAFSARDGYRLRFAESTSLPFPVETAISFHPWLRAVDGDGGPLRLTAAPDGRLILAAGARRIRSVTIAYRPPLGVTVARFIGILAFLGLIGLLLALPRRPVSDDSN